MTQLARKGDPISASGWNAILSRLIAGVGAGLTMRQTPDGVVLGLSGPAQWLLLARITSSPTQTDPPLLASAVTYSATAIGNAAATVTSATPLRWIEDATAVTPAAVGDLCFIIRAPEDDGTVSTSLVVLTEKPITAVCEEP